MAVDLPNSSSNISSGSGKGSGSAVKVSGSGKSSGGGGFNLAALPGEFQGIAAGIGNAIMPWFQKGGLGNAIEMQGLQAPTLFGGPGAASYQNKKAPPAAPPSEKQLLARLGASPTLGGELSNALASLNGSLGDPAAPFNSEIAQATSASQAAGNQIGALYANLVKSYAAAAPGIASTYANTNSGLGSIGSGAINAINGAYSAANSSEQDTLKALGIQQAAGQLATNGNLAANQNANAVSNVSQSIASDQADNTAHGQAAQTFNTQQGQAAQQGGAEQQAAVAANLAKTLQSLQSQAEAAINARQTQAMQLAQAQYNADTAKYNTAVGTVEQPFNVAGAEGGAKQLAKQLESQGSAKPSASQYSALLAEVAKLMGAQK